MSQTNSRVRLSVVGLIVMALFSVLLTRLWFLQVSSGESFAAQTEANRIRVVREPAMRGSILDRNGLPLTRSFLVDTVLVRRGLTDSQRRDVVPRLAKLLAMRPKQIDKLLDSPKFSQYEPVTIAENVPYDKVVYIKERPELFPKVTATRRSVREYPYGGIAPHLLGYVAAINAHELEVRKREGYGQSDVIGKAGVEQTFESELRGIPRFRKLEVDSRGRLVRVLQDSEAQAGHDVQLTLDIDIQNIAEESLRQGIESMRNIQDKDIEDRYATFKASAGAVVVLDASDASVVALASFPTFDQRQFTQGIPLDTFKQLTSPSSHFPLINRAVQGTYAPGSTFKLFTAIAALQSKTIDDKYTFNDTGVVHYGNPPRAFFNAGKRPHGIVDVGKAIVVSSDVFFYNIGFRLFAEYDDGRKRIGDSIQTVARDFGFGTPTGIGLPDEAIGRIPDAEFKRKLNADNPDRLTRIWLPGDIANVAVGQGDVLVTPIQLASAYATFANGGTLYSPRLASRVLDPTNGDVVRELPVQEVRKVELDLKFRALILNGLVGVTSSGLGTAVNSFYGYEPGMVAGKTGTAEVPNRQDTALFCGITPAEPPTDPSVHQYVVCAVIEEGGFGSSVAAPITRRIIDALNGNLEPPGVRVFAPADDDE